MLQDRNGPGAQAARPETSEINAKAQIKEYKETLIVDAAARLFYEKGFQRTTIDDIAAALGFTKPFVYTYFKSKHSILERLFDRVYDEVFEGATDFEAQAGPDPVERFKHFVSWYIRKNLDNRQFSAILLEEEKNLSPEKIADMRVKQREFDKLLAGLVSEGARAGVFQPVDPSLASLAISSVVRWTHRWYSPQGRMSPDEVCAELTQVALRIAGWAGESAQPAAPAADQPRGGARKKSRN